MYGLGVVIGKFLPPHRGHRLVIERAIEQSKHVVVIVCERPDDPIPGPLRVEWLREMHSSAEVLHIEDRYDKNDSRIWAENTVRWLGREPDAVFTSEDYGDRYAALMKAVHVPVDPHRLARPVSGTAVRADPYASWSFIDEPVRGWYAKRVCIVGAESTGKTTLARALAGRLLTTWVEEYGRQYTVVKLARDDPEWRSEEFVHIAAEQSRREDAAARLANRVLVCDTDAFATVIWHKRYLGGPCPDVEAIAARGRIGLYLLTGDEIPFEDDGLRDGEHIRHEMHRWFAEALAAQQVPWQLLRGSHETRLERALALIDSLFAKSRWVPSQNSLRV
jgi:HTH-type transcriptional repressor of NAD biosynthesis genes